MPVFIQNDKSSEINEATTVLGKILDQAYTEYQRILQSIGNDSRLDPFEFFTRTLKTNLSANSKLNTLIDDCVMENCTEMILYDEDVNITQETVIDREFVLFFNFWILGVLMPLIAVFGILANAASIVVLSHPIMRSSTINIYLAGLSAFDGLLLLFSLLLYPPMSFCELDYNPSSLWCRYFFYSSLFTYPLSLVMQSCSVWTLTAITVDRFIAISWPLRSRDWCTCKRAYISLAAIVAWSIFYNLPAFFELRLATRQSVITDDDNSWNVSTGNSSVLISIDKPWDNGINFGNDNDKNSGSTNLVTDTYKLITTDTSTNRNTRSSNGNVLMSVNDASRHTRLLDIDNIQSNSDHDKATGEQLSIDHRHIIADNGRVSTDEHNSDNYLRIDKDISTEKDISTDTDISMDKDHRWTDKHTSSDNNHVITDYDISTDKHVITYQELEQTDMRKADIYKVAYKGYCYLFFMLLIPAGAMLVLNVFVTISVRRAYRLRRAMSGREEKERRCTMMAVLVVVTFLICNSLAFVNNMIEIFGLPSGPSGAKTSYFLSVSLGNLLVALNSATNFLIYCALGVRFRRMFCQIFCLPRCHPKTKIIRGTISGMHDKSYQSLSVRYSIRANDRNRISADKNSNALNKMIALRMKNKNSQTTSQLELNDLVTLNGSHKSPDSSSFALVSQRDV